MVLFFGQHLRKLITQQLGKVRTKYVFGLVVCCRTTVTHGVPTELFFIIVDYIKKSSKKESDKNFENYSNFYGLVPQKNYFFKTFLFFNILPFYN